MAERGDVPTVAVLVEDRRNRDLLVDHLGSRHGVVAGSAVDLDDPAFECCLVDERAFDSARDRIATAKSEAAPVFLPVLLLAGQGGPDRVGPDVWDEVDEVLHAPVDPPELDKRLENLLERRRLSSELDRRRRYNEDRFRSLFETAPDPVFVTSPDGEIREVNDAFVRMFEVDPEDAAGQSLTDLGIEPRDEVDKVLLRIEDEDETAKATVRWGEDEDTLITEINAATVSELGEMTDRIGVVRDITSLKERERQLEEQNERLREFAGTISHDLRNPLEIAQGYVEPARETGKDEYFDEIANALDWMEQLVTEILHLAKQGETVLEATRIPLADAVVVAKNHVDLEDATIVHDLGDVEVEADVGRLGMLFQNLFRNAVEHSSTGSQNPGDSGDAVKHGDDVTIHVGVLNDGGGFYVEDDGPGLPDENQVFQTGFTTKEQGAGFGLSIVDQIVDGHGWTITATESTTGGARFEITDVDLYEFSTAEDGRSKTDRS